MYYDKEDVLEERVVYKEDDPYVVKEIKIRARFYNPRYGDGRLCNCGHTYARHFDFYEDEEFQNCGCKYCSCSEFVEKQ